MDVTDPAAMAVQPETADKIELVGLVSNIGVVSSAVVLRNKYPDVLTAFQMKTMGRI